MARFLQFFHDECIKTMPDGLKPVLQAVFYGHTGKGGGMKRIPFWYCPECGAMIKMRLETVK